MKRVLVNRFRPLWLLLLAGCLLNVQARTPRFGDMYDCFIITDVEVSDYEADDYEQIDCEEFMDILIRARHTYVSFAEAKEFNLYDDEGIRYKVYMSRDCRHFRVDSNYFKLPRRKARRLRQLIA